LEVEQSRRVLANRAGWNHLLEGEGRERATCLANAPFHWMDAVCAVGDARRPEVFAGRKEIVDAYRQQGAKRDFEGVGVDIDGVTPTGCAGVQVDPVGADPHTVGKQLCSPLSCARLNANMLLQDCEFGTDAPTFPEIGLFR
jgi:hypothetical protein